MKQFFISYLSKILGIIYKKFIIMLPLYIVVDKKSCIKLGIVALKQQSLKI